jgi:hypothetical protein
LIKEGKHEKDIFHSIILALSLLIGNSLPGYAAFTNETIDK